MESRTIEVEGVVYTLLLRIKNATPSSALEEYKNSLSSAARSQNQRSIWIQAGNSLEFWVEL